MAHPLLALTQEIHATGATAGLRRASVWAWHLSESLERLVPASSPKAPMCAEQTGSRGSRLAESDDFFGER